PPGVAARLVQAALRADLAERLRLRDGGGGVSQLRPRGADRRVRALGVLPLPRARRLARAARCAPLPLHVHVLRSVLALLHPRRLGHVREGAPLRGRRDLAGRAAQRVDRARAPRERRGMKVLHLVKTTRGATWALRQVTALRALGVDVTVA